MKLLNLYAGIGGNVEFLDRDKFDITSVEIDSKIAAVYRNRFPGDTLVVDDAAQYLLDYYNEYDFIWASPPCPTHSFARKALVGFNRSPVFPDMSLYQIIIFLQHHFRGKWVVENVKPYYKPLIEPAAVIDRHYFWSNFNITPIQVKKDKNISRIKVSDFSYIDFTGYSGRKDYVIRNMVNPLVGQHIINCAADIVPFSYEKSLFDFIEV